MMANRLGRTAFLANGAKEYLKLRSKAVYIARCALPMFYIVYDSAVFMVFLIDSYSQ